MRRTILVHATQAPSDVLSQCKRTLTDLQDNQQPPSCEIQLDKPSACTHTRYSQLESHFRRDPGHKLWNLFLRSRILIRVPMYQVFTNLLHNRASVGISVSGRVHNDCDGVPLIHRTGVLSRLQEPSLTHDVSYVSGS
jgi:hypothetical protein